MTVQTVDIVIPTPAGLDPAAVRAGSLRLGVDVSPNYSAPDPSRVYRLRITVLEANGVDPYIFIHEDVPVAAGQPSCPGKFVTVATLPYFHELPILEPNDVSSYMFRTTEVDLYYRTVAELVKAKDGIIARVEQLLSDMSDMAALRHLEVVNFSFSTDDPTGSSYVGGSTPA